MVVTISGSRSLQIPLPAARSRETQLRTATEVALRSTVGGMTIDEVMIEKSCQGAG